MRLSILGSDSLGNSYVIYDNDEALVIEAGIKFINVKKTLDFKISKIQGLIITHEHGDHSKYMNQYLDNGIDCYASKGTIDALAVKSKKPPKLLTSGNITKIGNFKVIPFNVIHDAAEPLGFLINHPKTGNILFLTDTHYSKYKFKNLNHILVEANYDQAIIENKIINGNMPGVMLNRLKHSHMSIATTLQLLEDNDLTNVNNIVLIHLSDGNSNAKDFKTRVENQTGKLTTIADKGVKIYFGLNPF